VKKRLFIIILLSLLGLAIVFWLMLGNILGYFLSNQVDKQSGGRVGLTIEKTDFNLLKGNILLENPVVTFDSVFIDRAKKIKINQVAFDSIVMKDVSLSALIFHRRFRAAQLSVEKPDIRFEGIPAAGNNQFKPDSLLAFLKRPHENKTHVDIRINRIFIHYGSISLEPDSVKSAATNLVDFKIDLTNFNTMPPPETKGNQILFSDDVFFELGNLHKMFLPGYILNLKSAGMSIKEKKVFFHDVLISPEWVNKTGKSKWSLKAGTILFNGIDLAKAEKISDLEVKSVTIADGYVSYFLPVGMKPKSDTLSKNELGELQTKLKRFDLDSLRLKNFAFYNISQKDTITRVADIHLKVNGLVIDSTTLSHPLRLLHNKELLLATGRSKFYIREKKVWAGFAGLNYSTASGRLSIKDVNMMNDTLSQSTPMNIHLDNFDLDDLHTNQLHAGRPITINVSAIRPDFTIDLDHPLFSTGTGTGNLSPEHYFHLQNVLIEDGAGTISRTDRFNITIAGLNVTCANLQLPVQKDSTGFWTDNLNLRLGSVNGFLKNKTNRIETGKLTFRNKRLVVNTVKGRFRAKGKTKNYRFGLDRLTLTGFDPLLLVNRNKVIIDTVWLIHPDFEGTAMLQPDSGNKNKRVLLPMDLPVGVNVGYLKIDEASLGLKINDPGHTPVHVNTTLNAQLRGINPGNRLDVSLISRLNGSLTFSDSRLTAKGHLGRVKKLGVDLSHHLLDVQDVTVRFNAGKGIDSSFRIKKFDLANATFTGLNYPLLAMEDSIVFRKLVLNDLQTEIVSKQKYENQKQGDVWDIEAVHEFAKIVYDTLSLNRIQLHVLQNGEGANSVFHLANLSISHFSRHPHNTNLISNLDMRFDSLSFSDTLNNTSLFIMQAHTNPADQSLVIEKFKTGDLFKKRNSIQVYDSTDFNLISEHVIFSGIYLQESLPSALSVNKLVFNHLSLFMNRKNTSKHSVGPGIDMNIILNYANLMTSLRVDSTVLNDVSVHYRTTGDSLSRTFNMDNIGLAVNGIQFDTAMLHPPYPEMVNNMVINLRGKSYVTTDSLYQVESGLISYNFPLRTISVDSFYVMPRYAEKTFYENAVWQTDRVKMFGRRLVGRNFDFEDFFKTDHFHLGKLSLDEVDLRIVRNMKYPLKPGIFKKMPQDILRSLNQKITIDTINITNSYLLYGEYSKKSDQPGMVYFDHFNINAYHLTNNYSAVPDTTALRIVLNAKVMGEARLDAEINFSLFSPDNAFRIMTISKPLDMTKLNGLTQNILGIAIKSGKGHISTSSIYGDETTARGSVLFRYRKLKLQMYDTKKSQVSSRFFSPLFNFFVNDLVLKSNNPKFARSPRKGIVYFERDTQRSIANYLWKSLLSGMLSTMGINTKGQRLEKKSIKKDNK